METALLVLLILNGVSKDFYVALIADLWDIVIKCGM